MDCYANIQVNKYLSYVKL